MDLRRIVHTPDGGLRAAAFAVLILAAPAVHARTEPKTLRYRLLHTAARITHVQRRRWLRLDRNWPWSTDLAAAFTRLAGLPCH